MANSKLATVAPIIWCETIASDFATAKTIATGGGTVPANVGGVWCFPSAACHYYPGTPTSSFGHVARANEPFWVPANQVTTMKIIGDAGAIALGLAYMRGSRPAITHAVSRPY